MMKNRRLCAIVLLAALALLQARVAFADCLNGEQMPAQPAAERCLEHTLPDGASQMIDEAGIECVPHCVKSATTSNDPDVRMLAASEFTLAASAPLLRSKFFVASDASLQLAGNSAATARRIPVA